MIVGKNLFNRLVKTDIETNDNIKKITTGQGHWLHKRLFTRLSLFQRTSKFIAVVLSKEQALDADPDAIQPIDFTGDLDRATNATIFSLLMKRKNAF